MLRHTTTACIFAGVLLIPQAHAACSSPNPLDALAGTWTFTTQGFNFPPTEFLASAGRFVATAGVSKGPNIQPLGFLAVSETASVDGGPTRLSIDPYSPPAVLGNSRYQVYDDCLGGNLQVNSGQRSDQLEFFFVNPDEIVFTGSKNSDIVSGSAKRVSVGLVAPVCPANPLLGLTGTWTFAVDGFHFPPTLFISTVGRFTPYIGTTKPSTNPTVLPVPIAVLDVTQASGIDGSPTRLESVIQGGHFALNENCSGGSVTINAGSRPVQYDFWFNNPDTMVMVGSNNGDIVVGTARHLVQ